MPSVITTIRPTTEVQAINIMLGAIGESPLPAATDLSATTDGNVEAAIEILKESVREVLTAGWRFNTLTGYEIAPTTTYVWTDTDGVSTTLNVFKVPADVLAWKQTPCSEMSDLELVERPSLKYQEAGSKVLVLFDRVRNRDGAEASKYPYLYLDTVMSVNFEQMPEAARKYAAVLAARRLAARVPGSESEVKFTEQDEALALRTLKREQGITKRFNLFDTADAHEIGGRRTTLGGPFRTTVYPGGQ